MKKIVTAMAAAALMAACTPSSTPPQPIPSNDTYVPEQPGKGGPCGDGTVLTPGTKCP